MPAKQPQDHKPAKGAAFSFTDGAGKKHTLPNIDVGRSRLSGRDLRNAVVGDEADRLGYLFKALEAADPNPVALDALYDMPQVAMVDVLEKWADHGDGDGASLGE